MRSVAGCGLVLALAAGCGGKTSLPCGGDGIASSSTGEALEYECTACDTVGDEGQTAACEGAGLVESLPDDCIDDGGESDHGDLLEVYCVGGIARFCLSHEGCPWRDGVDTGDQVTCSTAGLRSTYMASTIGECAGWRGHARYCCSADGRIGFGEE